MDKFTFSDQYRKYYRSLQPMLVKPKTKRYSTAIFFILTTALFGWYAIRPTIQTILYLRKEIVDKKAVNIQMDEKINALIEAQALLESLQPQLPVIQDVMPKNPQAVDIARQLQLLAETTNASISAIQIGAVPILTATASSTVTSYTVKQITIPVSITIDGPYPVLASFMSGLLAMQRMMTIDSISFSPNRNGLPQSGTNEIRLQLKLMAYYQTH